VSASFLAFKVCALLGVSTLLFFESTSVMFDTAEESASKIINKNTFSAILILSW